MGLVGSSPKYIGYLGLLPFKLILVSFGALAILRKLGLMIRDRRNTFCVAMTDKR